MGIYPILFTPDEFKVASETLKFASTTFDGEHHVCYYEVKSSHDLHKLWEAGKDCGIEDYSKELKQPFKTIKTTNDGSKKEN